MKSIKGQVNILAPAILALVFASVVLVFGLIIIQQTRDTNIVNSGISGSRVIETVTQAEREANTSVDAAASPGFGSLVVIEARNDSASGQIISSGNYTVGTNFIANTTVGRFYSDDWVVNYSFTYGGETYRVANETVVGMGTFADFWEIIVLAIVISVVISLLLLVFGGRRER